MDLHSYPGDSALRAAKYKTHGRYNEEEKEFTNSMQVGRCMELCKTLGCVTKTAEDFFYAYHENGKRVEDAGMPYTKNCGRSIEAIWEKAELLFKKIMESDGNVNHLTVTDCFLVLENHIILESWEGFQAEREFIDYMRNDETVKSLGWMVLDKDGDEDKNLGIDIKCYQPSTDTYMFLQVKPVSFFIDSKRPEKQNSVASIRRDRQLAFKKMAEGIEAFKSHNVVYRYVIFENDFGSNGKHSWLRDNENGTIQWQLSKLCDLYTGAMLKDIKTISSLSFLPSTVKTA